MAADLSAIAAAIKTRLETITALNGHCHDAWPDQPNVPAATAYAVSATYNESFDGLTTYVFEVILLAASAQHGSKAGEDVLNAYLDNSGSSSIKAAIEGDNTLGGTAHWVWVRGWRDRGVLTVNDVDYHSVTFDVEVGAE